MYSKASDATAAKAQEIYDSVISASGFRRRGLKYGAANYSDYGVNRDTNMSAALLELGFITNKNDNKLFDNNNDNIALAVAQALCEITGVDYKSAVADKKEDGEPESSQSVSAKGDSKAVYFVQCGAFNSLENAEKLATRLKNAGFESIIRLKGDIDGDGKITTDDARDLLRKATGLA